MKYKIGIFDSGRGGWYTLGEIKKLLPAYDYLFFGDTAHMPYGDKTPEQIRQYTFSALKRLFDQGCELVVTACNTAAAYSIRDRQQHYPNKKTLSVTIPGIEELIAHHVRSTLFLSTKATEQSGILADLAFKYGYQGAMTTKSCSGLADIIEHEQEHPLSTEEKKKIITDYVGDVSDYESIVLACTHYGLRYAEFCELYPQQIIIDPSQACALKLQDYLTRHPETGQKLTKGGTITEHWTQ